MAGPPWNLSELFHLLKEYEVETRKDCLERHYAALEKNSALILNHKECQEMRLKDPQS